MINFEAGQLKVSIYENRKQMGTEAAKMAAARVRELLDKKKTVSIIFAAASSQNEFLESLINEKLDWQRVNAFHMDEYIGLSEDAPQQFSRWLKERLFDNLPFREVFYLNGRASDPQAECARYAALLESYPPDITCMGIGENTHLAFNDPHVADFHDSHLVKVVDLDEASKQQQVNEDCFDDISQIPPDALTLTIPALLKADYIFCMVPGALKAQAVYHTLTADITEQYPSTILRTHPHACLFLEKESAAKILQEKKHQSSSIPNEQ
jgi:glucosamine-6-phosphate deaminase